MVTDFGLQTALLMFTLYAWETGCSAPPIDTAFSVLSVLNSMQTTFLMFPQAIGIAAQVLRVQSSQFTLDISGIPH